MARKRTKLTLSAAQAAELKEQVRAATDPRDKERLQVVLWATSGQHSLAALAALAGRARSTIQIWLDDFAAGGVGQLLERTPPPGKPSLVAGAKVQALTLFDLMTQPKLVSDAKAYFAENQTTKESHYIPFLRATDKPSTFLNKATQDKYRPELKKFYYDADKYPTYLDQLGIKYPTVRTPETAAKPAATGEAEDDGGSQQ